MEKDKWKTLLERALPSGKTVGEFLREHPAHRSKVLLKNGSIIDDETSLADTQIFGSLEDITEVERRLYVIKYSSGSASFTLPQEAPFSIGQCLNDLFPGHTFLADFYDGTSNQNYELPGDRELTSLDAANYTWSRAIYVYSNETTFQVSFNPSSPGTHETLISMDLPLSYRVPGKALFNLDSIISFATEKFSKEFSFTLNLKPSFVVQCKRANGLVVPISLKPLGEINTEKLTKTDDITELEDYEQIAHKLKEGTYIKKFIKLVDTIHENISGRHDLPITPESDLNSPYIAVLGPSGSGKTQLAYALNAADCSCVHLLMLEEYKGAQSIYQASKSLSRSFLKAIDEDVIELGKSHEDVCELVSSCNFLVRLKGIRLSTIGFLHSVLSARLERDSSAWKAFLNQDATHTYEPMSAETFFSVWKDKPNIPCIILDEFNLEFRDSIDKIKERELIPLLLARNVIRALGLVCITMGTNSAASNLIAPDFLGREGTAHRFVEGSTAWVLVVHKLQPVVFDAVPGFAEFRAASSRFRNDETWSPFFQWLEVDMTTSNPRLLRFAFAGLTNYLNDNPDNTTCTVQNALTQMMAHMVKHTIGTKYEGTRYFRWALLGQIGHLIAHSDNHFCSHLIHTYFNHLLPPSQWTAASSGVRVNAAAAQPFREFLMDDNFCCLLLRARDESGQIFLSTTTGISWHNAESYFPSVDEDNLLALALLTFSDPDCFFLDGSTSLYKALFRTFMSTMHPGKDPRRGPAATATTKGYLWEILMHLSAIISSVSLPGKLNGTPIDQACLEFMRNLHKGPNVNNSLTAANECYLRYFCRLLKEKCPRLPMLGPVDDSFGFLKKFIPDALVGMLRSCENAEQVDGVIDSCSVNDKGVDLPESESESNDEDVDKENDVYDKQPNDALRNESTKRFIVSSDSSGDVTFIFEGKARAIGKNIGNGVIGSVAGKGERVPSSYTKRVIFLYSFGAKFNPKAAKRRWLPERHQAVFLSSASANELKFTGYVGNGRGKDATMIDSTTFKPQTLEENKTNVNGRSADEITTIIVILAARGVYEEDYIIDNSDIQHGVNLLEPYLKAQQGIDNLLKRRIVVDEDSPAAKRIKDRY